MGSWIYSTLFFLIQVCVTLAVDKATLELDPISYVNPNGKDWNNDLCDYFIKVPCDHMFDFCIDNRGGDTDPDHCALASLSTDQYHDSNTNYFHGSKLLTVRFPNGWPGSVLFKVYVEDNDDGHTRHDKVDELRKTIAPRAARSKSEATWTETSVTGLRSSYKTTLRFRYRVYCHSNYYGPSCSVYCLAQNGNQGHYTCHPDTGAKICRAGWENPSGSCKTWSNDCDRNNCQNGATCIDGVRSYACRCRPGYKGRYCEEDINFCESSPCQNGATCVDGLLSYTCNCADGYLGTDCSLHVCNSPQTICKNGGSCYGSGQCYCPPGYVGSTCDVSMCDDVIRCQNSGTCNPQEGFCDCPPGIHGKTCSLDLCDIIPCHNGGHCSEGKCACASGYTGDFCEKDINDCTPDLCKNDGSCVDLVNGFYCLCLPGMTGNYCESTIPPPPPEVYTLPPPETDGVNDTDWDTTYVPGYPNTKDPTYVVPDNPDRNTGAPRDPNASAVTGQVVGINWLVVVIILAILLAAALTILVLFIMKFRRTKKQLHAAEASFHGDQGVVNPVYHLSNGQTGCGRPENEYVTHETHENPYDVPAVLCATGYAAAPTAHFDVKKNNLHVDLKEKHVYASVDELKKPTNAVVAETEGPHYSKPPAPRPVDGARKGEEKLNNLYAAMDNNKNNYYADVNNINLYEDMQANTDKKMVDK